MKKISLFFFLILFSLVLAACEKDSHLIADAKNETITESSQLNALLEEAETYFFKDYYFYDLRDHDTFKLGFVGGFKNVESSTLVTAFKDKPKYSMIVLFGSNTSETTSNANILIEMGFYNVKVIDLTFSTIFDELKDRILIIGEDGNSCPIIPEPDPGC